MKGMVYQLSQNINGRDGEIEVRSMHVVIVSRTIH